MHKNGQEFSGVKFTIFSLHSSNVHKMTLSVTYA